MKLRNILANNTTAHLLNPLPPWRRALVRLTHQHDINFDKIVNVIAVDPCLCARLLSFSRPSDLSLGSAKKVIRHILIREKSHLLGKLVEHNVNYYKTIDTCRHFSLKKYWLEAINVATAAQQLSRLKKLGGNIATQAYFAGILHNIGLIALIYLHPEAMNQILKKSLSAQELFDYEKKYFAFDHTELATEILMQQRIPDPVIMAIKTCRQPFNKHQHSPLTEVIIHALEWQHSHTKKHTSLGQLLDKDKYKQLIQTEQRILDRSDIFAYESENARFMRYQ